MGRKRNILSAVIVFAQVCGLAAAIALSPGGARASAAGSLLISGTVTNSSGSGVTGVSVTATDPGGSVVESGPVTTASNGAYTLPVDTGTYDIHFVPAGGSGLNPIVSSNVTVLADQTLNVQLTPVTHTFSGTLTDANGSPIAGASLAFPQGAGGVFSTTDASGHFSITIKAGTYPLSVSISGHAGYPQSVGVSGPTIDLTSGDVTQDLQIPYQSTSLTVLAKDGNGAAAADVFVGAGAVAHSVSLASGLPASQVTDGSTMPRTDSAGSSVGTYFAGDVFAAGSICVNFGAGTGSICNTSTVTLNSATTVTISKPTTHTFSGIFNNASGNPLPNVTLAFAVGAGGVTSTTDAAGHFSITTTPTVHGLSASFSNVSGYPQSVGITGPGIDLTNGDITQNLQLSLPTATLTVNAIDANGNPVSSAFVSGGPQNVTAQLYPGAPDSQVQGVSPFGSTNSSGTASGLFFDGATFSAGNICVNFGAGTGVVCSTGAVTLNGSTSVTIRKPGGHTLSGTLTDANGNPIAGASLTLPINATSGVTSTTDASGHFSMTIQAGVHGLSGSITGHAGYPQSVQFTGPSFDLTSSDITQNLQLSIQPRTLTVVVKDANGNGVVDIPVNAAPGQITTQLFAGGTTLVQGIDTLSHTNTSGTTSGTYLDGAVFAAGSICANLGGGIGNICNSTPVTLNGNATLVLQQQPSAPAAPTNLSAVSPTMTAPALTWNTVSGATSYNVYRDGNAVGTSTAASYTDSAATEGSHVYTVKAVQAGVESAPSNAVTVILDKTRPVLNFTSPTSFAGPFSTGPFVTVTASDPGSGLNNLVIHVYTSANVLLNICGSATAAQLAAGSMSCDLSPLANGTYFVRAGSFDKAGNNRTINSTNFVIAR